MPRKRTWDHGGGDFREYPPNQGPDHSNPKYAGIQVIKMFQPYQEVIGGTMIKSRHEHREFLARNDVEEAGSHREPWQKDYDQTIADGGSDEEAAEIVKAKNNQPEPDGLTEHERGKFDISFEYQDASPAEMEAL